MVRNRAIPPELVLLTVNHPYHKAFIAFATMHKKEQVLAPLFTRDLSAQLVVPTEIDTDQFGTFSGEIPREHDVKTTLKSKALLGAKLLGLPLAVASEGSFSFHPLMPQWSFHQEALVFLDLDQGLEIFVHVNSDQQSAQFLQSDNDEEIHHFISNVLSQKKGLIVRANESAQNSSLRFKGLKTASEVFRCIDHVRLKSQNKMICLETDNRAHQNPTRREVIRLAGEQLILTLKSLCPSCATPGFQMTDFVRGLPCSDCGLRSQKAIQEIWSCPQSHCDYSELKPRKDGVTHLSPSECDWCNP
jgi:hypothetical protein